RRSSDLRGRPLHRVLQVLGAARLRPARAEAGAGLRPRRHLPHRAAAVPRAGCRGGRDRRHTGWHQHQCRRRLDAYRQPRRQGHRSRRRPRHRLRRRRRPRADGRRQRPQRRRRRPAVRTGPRLAGQRPPARPGGRHTDDQLRPGARAGAGGHPVPAGQGRRPLCPPGPGRGRWRARRRSFRPPAVPGPRHHRRRHRQRAAGSRCPAPQRQAPGPGPRRPGHRAAVHDQRAPRWREGDRRGRRRRRAPGAAAGPGRGAGSWPRVPASFRHRAGGAGHGRGRRRRADAAHPRYPCRGRAPGSRLRPADPRAAAGWPSPYHPGVFPLMSARIPTFDITRYDTDREAFVAELGAAYREWGFAGISNHGIPPELIDNAYAAFQKFFALPEEVKKKYHVPGGGGARGYTPFGVETAKGSKHFDLKEFWHIGREIPDDSKYREVMAPNLWPEEVPEFREYGYALYQALDSLGSRVLSALALHIGLPEDFFADKTNCGNSILRPIHYPPITADDIPNVRAGAHGDINFITLLVGASAAGLEVRSHEGEWVPFTSEGDTIVVNI